MNQKSNVPQKLFAVRIKRSTSEFILQKFFLYFVFGFIPSIVIAGTYGNSPKRLSSVNSSPVANNDVTKTFENTSVTINAVGNDTDSDGAIDPSTVDLDPSVSGIQTSYSATQGNWSVNASGVITFTPISSFNGVATKDYTVNDDQGATSNSANISITVQGTACFTGFFQSLYYPSLGETDLKALNVNTNPFSYTVVKVYRGVQLNATGYNVKDGLVYGVNLTNNHVVSVSPGTYTYVDYGIGNAFSNVGDCDTSGNYYFTANLTNKVYKINTNITPYTITTATMTAQWDPSDWAFDPATKKFYGVNGVTLYVYNPTGNTVTTTPITGAIGASSDSYGAVWWGGTGILYASDNQTGRIYRITVSTSSSIYAGQGEVTGFNDGYACPVAAISFNFPPVTSNDVAVTEKNTSVSLSVLSNDNDPDGSIDASSVDLNPSVSGIQNTYSNAQGNWSVNSSGIITYSPATNYTGSTSITYKVDDDMGATSNAATVTVTVNIPPVANNDAGVTAVNTPVTITVTANDTDPDGAINTSTVDLDINTSGRQTTYTTSDGGWSVDNSGKLTYTPASGFTGIAVTNYNVKDNNSSVSNNATVSITVTQAPVANNDSATTNEETPVTFNLVSNDTDDGNVDAATVDLDPATPGKQTTYSSAQGFWSVNNSGSVTFSPFLNYNGRAGINYTVKDNIGVSSNIASIIVTVSPVNDPPVANNDATVTSINTAVVFNILSNDADVDGTIDSLSIDLDPSVAGTQDSITTVEGTWTADANGNVTFTPVNNYLGSASIYYTIKDNNSAVSNQATITVTVKINTCTLTASASAGTISCKGGTTFITVTASGGTSPYNGTGTFIVPAGSYIYTVSDANGCTATCSATIARGTGVTPDLPGHVYCSQTTNLCPGNTISCYIDPVNNTTAYTWEIPANSYIISGQGTNSILLGFSNGFSKGAVNVRVSNDCGSRKSECIPLSNKPSTPIITGQSCVVASQSGVYYYVINPESGIDYKWRVPPGARITSGQGTSVISVDWQNTVGNVSCTATNQCSGRSVSLYPVVICASPARANSIQKAMQAIPNITSGNSVIIFNADSEKDFMITLTDANGRIVLNKNITSMKGENRVQINVSNLTDGIYIINLISDTQKQTAKLIKE